MIKKYSILLLLTAGIFTLGCSETKSNGNNQKTPSAESAKAPQETEEQEAVAATLDTAAYNLTNRDLANGDTSGYWPVKNQPYPLSGAILPFKRVIAYYGNLYSKRMGILGEYAPKEMLSRLNVEVKKWEKADPKTPV